MIEEQNQSSVSSPSPSVSHPSPSFPQQTFSQTPADSLPSPNNLSPSSTHPPSAKPTLASGATPPRQPKSLSDFMRLGVAGLFILVTGLFVYLWVPAPAQQTLLIISAMVGAYMAMNIGANDVANNVGPAVGSKAMTLMMALVVAAICEAAGALIAGGDVVNTIKSGIIDPNQIHDTRVFVWLMLASLLAGAIWLNFATAVGAPVSTTHSIVGAVLGAGLAAAGASAVNWSALGNIVLSWIISPLMGGVIAAALLYFLKYTITYKSEKSAAASKVVPWLMAVMTWVFAAYLLIKGLKHVLHIGIGFSVGASFIAAVVVFFLSKRKLSASDSAIDNSKSGVNRLFAIPLIFSAGILSFAHGSNDVANAVGPLAAIIDTIEHAKDAGFGIGGASPIPLWVMVVGGLGISVGLALFGPKLIKTVGTEITELDEMRAFCIALSAGVTVIIASQLGLPVSSTHIAVGGVFGVGFLREYLKTNYARMLEDIRQHYRDSNTGEIDDFMKRFESASLKERGQMLREMKQRQKEHGAAPISKIERKSLKSAYKKELVKRSLVIRIAAAWLITVPASALLGAMMFYMLRGMLMP
jgi:PiT family inorganic phosphate transporter